MCPISNLQTKAVSGPAFYPIREFLDHGALVTVLSLIHIFYIGDLIQDGNMSLLLALAEEMPEEGKAGWMEQRLLAGMESWVKEQTEQKYRDESMVEKVRKLEAAIRELSDDEEQKFSVEELAAYLDMDEEEIRAVLRLTSEGADEEK